MFVISAVEICRSDEAAPPGAQPVSHAAAQNLAEQIQKTIRAGDPTFLREAIDNQAIVDTATKGLALSPATTAGLMSGGGVGTKLSDKLVDEVKKGASFRLLRILDVNGQQRPLYRLIGGGGLNYEEMSLATAADGRARVVDVYVYATGEEISATLRRPLLAVAAEQNRGLLSRLLGSESDYVAHFRDVTTFTNQTSAGQWAAALGTYDGFPESLKHDKTMMLLRIRNSQQAGQAKYTGAMEEYRTLFPSDPSQMLMSIDDYYLRKDYDGEIAVLDKLDARLGGDPYLNLYRGGARIAQGRADEGKKLLQIVTKAEPFMRKPWMALVTQSLKEKDFAETARLLTLSTQKAGIHWTRVATAPSFAEFVKSNEYAEWAKTQPPPPKPGAAAPSPAGRGAPPARPDDGSL